jgi:alkylation response protein AidB-like acyl-CoA dehydrogenase
VAVITADDRTALVDALTRLLTDTCAEADVRRAMGTPEGYDADLWRELAAMGVLGLVVEEPYGGVGAGPVELERVMEAIGAFLVPSPLISSAVLVPGLLQALGDEDAKRRLLPSLADGSIIATVALTGPKGSWTLDDVSVTAERSGDEGWTLNGAASFVTHGQVADVMLVMARTANGPAVFETRPSAAGVAVKPLPTFDHTLRLAEVGFETAPAVQLANPERAWAAAEAAMDLARVALAGEQAGGARRVLDMTVDYAKTRVQFGRQIGGFQAIKHMAADLLLETESAISAARHAAAALAGGAPDAGAAISLAAFACADAYVQVAATGIQIHGGIAFPWDHPAHLYLRRARADAQLFGTSAAHRERFLQHLGA